MKESVEILKSFGLTEYQSKALAALFERADSTAKDISRVGEIPETKVYAILDSLEDLGFLSASLERPKKFRATEPEFIIQTMVDKQRKVVEDLDKKREKSIGMLNDTYREGSEHETSRRNYYVQGMGATWREVAKMADRADEYMYLMGDATAYKEGYKQSEPIQAMLNLIDRGGELRFIFPHDFDLSFASKIPIKSKDLIKYYAKPNFKLRVSRDPFNITLIVIDDKEIATGLHNGKVVYGGFFSKDEKMALNFKDYYLNLWSSSKEVNKLMLDLIKTKITGIF